MYGGAPVGPQWKALRHGVDIVVATPGRAIDLMNRGALRLDDPETVVLDEADEMLDMGFIEDIETLPLDRHSAATIQKFHPRILMDRSGSDLRNQRQDHS